MSKKILIVAPNWIGDAVLCLPVVDGCARSWPEADLTVLARARVAELFKARESGVRVLQYEKGNGPWRLGNLLSLGRRLRREDFKLAVLLPNSMSSAMMVWLARVPERVGYATDGRGWLLTHRLKDRRKERGLHQVDYYLGLLVNLGVGRMDRIPRLQLKAKVADTGQTLLRDLGIGKDEIIIGVHPGAAYGETKRWFPERFGAVLERLHGSGRRILLLGGPGEEPLAEQICMRIEHPPVNLVGRTTVSEALALVNQCSLFLSNDSGLMHVAAALNIPQVALFGSSDPQKTAPLNDRAVVIHHRQVSCTPCFKSSCPEDLECLKAITVDEVCGATERLLNEIESDVSAKKGQQQI
ncbi:MAG: lipopolysaccharide heptosyltransferase II [Deltaproteobacteria bacterium]|nr:MAG: lipopolysaccharide heptosyltransferase II [Deltaproteobacteria bacterium]